MLAPHHRQVQDITSLVVQAAEEMRVFHRQACAAPAPHAIALNAAAVSPRDGRVRSVDMRDELFNQHRFDRDPAVPAILVPGKACRNAEICSDVSYVCPKPAVLRNQMIAAFMHQKTVATAKTASQRFIPQVRYRHLEGPRSPEASGLLQSPRGAF